MGTKPSRARRKAMEAQCAYLQNRNDAGCPCEDVVDCRVPDSLLLAECGLRYLDYGRRLEGLRQRVAERLKLDQERRDRVRRAKGEKA